MKNELYDRANRYLNNELSDEERRNFEKECEADPELSGILKEQLQYRHAVLLQGRSKYKKLFELEASGAGEEKASNTIGAHMYWRAAAVIALLIASGVVLYQRLKPAPGMQGIYLSYIEELPSPGVRSDLEAGLTDMEKSWNSFIEAYQGENWEEGINQLNQLLADPEFQNKGQAHLYLGIAYLKTDQEQKALESLQKIDETNQSLYFQSRWYALLAYLKLEEKENAIQLLRLLENSKSYGKKAQKIRSMLD